MLTKQMNIFMLVLTGLFLMKQACTYLILLF